MPEPRCPSCGHFWSSHVTRARNLILEHFCWTAGCKCAVAQPQRQTTVEA